MATMFRIQSDRYQPKKGRVFDAIAELKKHAWRQDMTIVEAEEVLAGKPSYTYVTIPRSSERGYLISFVNLNGSIEHHPFTLIDSTHGIWRNSHPQHVGSLSKVICDMMECGLADCRPLN